MDRHLLDNINQSAQHNIKGILLVKMCLVTVGVNVREDEVNTSVVED